METRNANIYHCLACGHVAHTEIGVAPPVCCGQPMEKACTETIREGNLVDEYLNDEPETLPPDSVDPPKPR